MPTWESCGATDAPFDPTIFAADMEVAPTVIGSGHKCSSGWPGLSPTLFEASDLLDDLKKALGERVLNAEMGHHLVGQQPANRCKRHGKMTVDHRRRPGRARRAA
jgi:hypothetical protein